MKCHGIKFISCIVCMWWGGQGETSNFQSDYVGDIKINVTVIIKLIGQINK